MKDVKMLFSINVLERDVLKWVMDYRTIKERLVDGKIAVCLESMIRTV